jgi:hypothetical protein
MKNRTTYLLFLFVASATAISFLLWPTAEELFQKIIFSNQPANYYDIFSFVSVVSLMTMLAGISTFIFHCEFKRKKNKSYSNLI